MKVKNRKSEYISRASLHLPKDAHALRDDSVEINPDRYTQAQIDNDWYIDFSGASDD